MDAPDSMALLAQDHDDNTAAVEASDHERR